MFTLNQNECSGWTGIRSLFEVLLLGSDKIRAAWQRRIDTPLEDEAVIDTRRRGPRAALAEEPDPRGRRDAG